METEIKSPQLSKEELLKNAKDVICSSCGNPTFVEVVMLKRISAIISPSGKATLLPIEGLQCSVCHKLLEIKPE